MDFDNFCLSFLIFPAIYLTIFLSLSASDWRTVKMNPTPKTLEVWEPGGLPSKQMRRLYWSAYLCMEYQLRVRIQKQCSSGRRHFHHHRFYHCRCHSHRTLGQSKEYQPLLTSLAKDFHLMKPTRRTVMVANLQDCHWGKFWAIFSS